MRLHWLIIFGCLWFPMIVQFSDGSLVWYRYPTRVHLDNLPGEYEFSMFSISHIGHVVANPWQPLTYDVRSDSLEDPETEEWFDKMMIHKKNMARSGGQYDHGYQQSQPRALRFG
ncbi:hypothetical protein EG68_02974 [Paragonimus skrjabini miyazakii]|uniref:Uncharacterized protein n=1 Tax=Paragonimus skrjabini miyazakii TaxID=59628 RepID=A0A8S9YYT3_9TREM|nr:hypothetical protein EG68_02974 [Paragonimus skrjabini miyazakii]